MSKIQDSWTKAGATLGAFSPFYQEGMFRLVRDLNAPNNWFALTQVRSAEPNPFRVADMQAGNPYASPDRQRETLGGLVEAGVLDEVEDGRFCLNERGRAIVDGFYSMAHENLKDVKPLADEELGELTELLCRIVEATDNAAEPAVKANLRASRWTDPGSAALPVIRIDQYVTDLLRFRDDAHLGAWQRHDVSGPAWEALTYIWREDNVNTPETLAEQLNRGYTADDYKTAVQELINKGWVKAENGHYEVSEKGASVREAAEADTDRLFYQGWATLNDGEVERLDDLLGLLNDRLNDLALVAMWPLANGVSAAINPVTRAAVNLAFNEIYGENGRFFFQTLLANGKAPQAYRAEDHVNRFPYANIKRIEGILKDAAEAGYMNNHGDGSFTLTDKARGSLEAINDVFYGALGELETAADDVNERTERLLGKLVEASLTADKPADKRPLLISHNSHTHPDAAPLARIDQRLDDLNAFRDACHVSAWRSEHDVPGRTWEALAFVYDGRANTAAALAEALPNRGYGEDDYADSLAELVELGWVEEGPDGLQVTEKGRQVRQTAEDKTNEYFYAPWLVLENNELYQLRTGLNRLKVSLEGLAAAQAA